MHFPRREICVLNYGMRMTPRLRFCLALLGPFLFAGSVRAADAAWKAGFAAQKITPGEPLMLAGYAARTVPARGVTDDLHAKALALEDATGARVILITADLIGFRADFSEPVCTTSLNQCAPASLPPRASRASASCSTALTPTPARQ
jgi:hypothetical protein